MWTKCAQTRCARLWLKLASWNLSTHILEVHACNSNTRFQKHTLVQDPLWDLDSALWSGCCLLQLLLTLSTSLSCTLFFSFPLSLIPIFCTSFFLFYIFWYLTHLILTALILNRRVFLRRQEKGKVPNNPKSGEILLSLRYLLNLS